MKLEYKILTKEEWSYIAGFIDGEGCITLTNPKKVNTRFVGEILIVNTNIFVLRWIKHRILGNLNKRKKQSPNHKTAYCLKISKREDIIRILDNIYPYLKIKDRQARIILDLLKSRDSIKNKFGSKEIIAINRIRRLNKKGVRNVLCNRTSQRKK
jgi:hypothetical protein